MSRILSDLSLDFGHFDLSFLLNILLEVGGLLVDGLLHIAGRQQG